MPLFRYKCAECKEEFEKILIRKESSIKCVCGKEAMLSLPRNTNAMVFDTTDKRRGVKVRKNQTKKLKQRFNDHMRRYELEERVDKYGIDEAIRNGWTKKIKKT